MNGINPFAVAASKADGPCPPPPPFDVQVSKLHDNYARHVTAAIERRSMDACSWDGEWWVCRTDLIELAGPGSDTADLEGGCYIPGHAVISRER
jgi:hypothetical protein